MRPDTLATTIICYLAGDCPHIPAESDVPKHAQSDSQASESPEVLADSFVQHVA